MTDEYYYELADFLESLYASGEFPKLRCLMDAAESLRYLNKERAYWKVAFLNANEVINELQTAQRYMEKQIYGGTH